MLASPRDKTACDETIVAIPRLAERLDSSSLFSRFEGFFQT